MADTQALVNAQAAAGKTVEQTRRSISNPFSLSIRDSDSMLMCKLGDAEPVEIGVMTATKHGNRSGYIVLREGVALNTGGAEKAQATRSDAAYYGLRNLLSRAATRDIDPKSREANETLRVVAQKNEQRANVAETQARVMAGLMRGDLSGFTIADLDTLDTELVKALPANFKATLAKAIKALGESK